MVFYALNRYRVCSANHGHSFVSMERAKVRLIGDGFLAEDREFILLDVCFALVGVTMRILDNDLERIVGGKNLSEKLLFRDAKNASQFANVSLGLSEENRL